MSWIFEIEWTKIFEEYDGIVDDNVPQKENIDLEIDIMLVVEKLAGYFNAKYEYDRDAIRTLNFGISTVIIKSDDPLCDLFISDKEQKTLNFKLFGFGILMYSIFVNFIKNDKEFEIGFSLPLNYKGEPIILMDNYENKILWTTYTIIIENKIRPNDLIEFIIAKGKDCKIHQEIPFIKI
ncbi:MAG: hypothetical protein Kow0068_19740 [Marinilabiliales bacterium]